MMIKLLALSLFITFSFNTFSSELLSINDREGKSFFSKEFTKKKYKKFKESADLFVIEDGFLLEAHDEKNCASTIYKDLKAFYKEKTSASLDGHDASLYLREQNLIDDIILNIFLNLSKIGEIEDLTQNIKFNPKAKNELEKFLQKAKVNGFCIEDEFPSFANELKGLTGSTKKAKLKTEIKKQAKEIKLDKEKTNFLLNLLKENFHEANKYSLSSYLQKKSTLRSQYPLVVENEYSDFVTTKVKKTKSSIRMELFKKYSYIQIILMGKIITDLRNHLDSEKIEILVYERDTDNIYETISLDPMERFRFAIAYLRKKIDSLSVNSFFNGMRPSYEEVIAASFELGIITSSEWEEVRGLEFIWNPQKTFWDKAAIWGKAILPLTAILIPPPYGFVATLSVVAIDIFSNKDDAGNGDLPHSLFK